MTQSHSYPDRPVATQPAYDLIVVGAGGVGSAAAYHAARRGHRVLLLEQFTIGHTRGSSHGGSRIIRYTHDRLGDTAQMPATFALWRELEQLSGVALLQMTGGLYIGSMDEPWLRRSREALTALGFPFRLLSGDDLAAAYPQWRFAPDWVAVEQDDSGILAASTCVATLAAQAQRFGAQLREQTPVASIVPDGDGVIVRTAAGEPLRSDRAILAAGPWSSRFLRELVNFTVPLRVTHQQVAYFAARDVAAHSVGRFPLFIVTEDPHFYGFPIFERAGLVKVALEQSEVTVDPDGPRAVDSDLLDRLCALVAQHLPGLDPAPLHVETCLYTETPTREFVIDRHPEHAQIVIAAGFSGRGFKHTIAVGHLLVDLATHPAGDYDLPFWQNSYALGRFAPQSAPTHTYDP